jgi:hypothetical protein
MLPEYFVVVGAVIASLGGFYYLYQTIIGKTKPNRVTWLLWWVLPMIVFIAQRVQGVEGASWATFAAGFTPLLVVIASFFNKHSYWKTAPVDYVLMAAAFVGILLWFFTKDPNLAIAFTLLADFFASLPTIIKTFKHPETESWVAYAISAFGFGIAILAITTFDFQNAAFVIYLAIINATVAVLALRPKERTLRRSK